MYTRYRIGCFDIASYSYAFERCLIKIGVCKMIQKPNCSTALEHGGINLDGFGYTSEMKVQNKKSVPVPIMTNERMQHGVATYCAAIHLCCNVFC